MTGQLTASRRAAVVTAVNASPPTVTVAIGGDTASPVDVPYLASYEPLVDDPVTVLSVQGTHLVLGHSAGPPGHVEFVDLSPTGFTGQTSTGYALVPDSTSGTFVKARSGTRVRFDLRISGYVATTATKTGWGVRINVVSGPGSTQDVDVVSMTVNPISTHTAQSGIAWITGLPAGSYTFTVLVRRPLGTGGTNNQDANDFIVYEADERL